MESAMRKVRTLALTGTMLAALSLTACGDDEAEEVSGVETAPEEVVVAEENIEPAEDAGDVADIEVDPDVTDEVDDMPEDGEEIVVDEAEETTETAAVTEDDSLDEPATDVAAADENDTDTGGDAAEETVSIEPQPMDEENEIVVSTGPESNGETVEAGSEESAAADAEYPALGALAGGWAESQELCETQSLTISDGTIGLPDGECQVSSTEIGNGELDVELMCGGEAGEQSWTFTEAEDDTVTLDRGDGEALELVRCAS